MTAILVVMLISIFVNIVGAVAFTALIKRLSSYDDVFSSIFDDVYENIEIFDEYLKAQNISGADIVGLRKNIGLLRSRFLRHAVTLNVLLPEPEIIEERGEIK